VSPGGLRSAAARLRLDQLPERERARIRLLQGSVTYADDRLTGFDAVVLSEVVEHVDPPRLDTLAAAVFGAARPATVLVTTPNAEYNPRWESLPAGHMRHPDHRFEWTRAEFAAWAREVGDAHGYAVRHVPVGPVDAGTGPPTQLAVFRKEG
jgi:3' terminal RNA ribose 2'-O-methyltransferase Hen1